MKPVLKPLKVVLYGATGMVGSGVLKGCLEDPFVKSVLVLGRRSCGVRHPKLKELLLKDLFDHRPVAGKLRGHNTCFFAVGTTSIGLNEAQYTRLTYDLTLEAAKTLKKSNPGMAFVYVSGQGSDSSEKGSVMWARVRGRLENKLLSMGFKPAVVVRPAAIIPGKGVRSRTFWVRAFYALFRPLLVLLLPVLPGFVTTSERLSRAMLRAARGEAGRRILESRDINEWGL